MKSSTTRIIAQSLIVLVGVAFYFHAVNETKWLQQLWGAFLVAGLYLAGRLIYRRVKSD